MVVWNWLNIKFDTNHFHLQLLHHSSIFNSVSSIQTLSLSSSLLPPHSSNLSLLLHSKIHFPFLTTTFPYDIVTFFSSFNFTSLYYLLLFVLKNSSSRVLPLLFFSLSNVCSVFCERKNGYLEIGVLGASLCCFSLFNWCCWAS